MGIAAATRPGEGLTGWGGCGAQIRESGSFNVEDSARTIFNNGAHINVLGFMDVDLTTSGHTRFAYGVRGPRVACTVLIRALGCGLVGSSVCDGASVWVDGPLSRVLAFAPPP